jgi:hypothetical protein
MMRLPGRAEPLVAMPARCGAGAIFLTCLLLASPLAAQTPATPPTAEDLFLEVRELGDSIRTREARGLAASEARKAYPAALAALRAALSPGPAGPAAAEMRAALARGELEEPPPAAITADAAPDCLRPLPPDATLPALRARSYACYSHAATAIRVEGRVTDRLSLLKEIAGTDDAARRRQLFLAMEPMFRTMDGDGGAQSPFRRMQPMVAAQWRDGYSPVRDNLAALGMEEALLEPWLVSILQAWSELTAGSELEPWDYEFSGNPVERVLGGRVPHARLREINDAFHASLGADVVRLGIGYDIERRPGKTAVAFTDFGARPARRAGGSWSSGAPWVIAGYATGGIGNLNELLHETGHAIHIAAIRTTPAFADWPDSNAFTEALAEVISQEVYEPAWQARWLGAQATLEENLRSRYSGIVLDVAWSLFELRAYADPVADPNRLWSDICARYLHVKPHPELAWWARRGQLLESPGYMLNYGLGAILAADMRARARELRGPATGDDPGYYAWLSEQLFRFGREKPSGEVLREFLGRPPDPGALLADLRRAGSAASSATRASPRPATHADAHHARAR